MPPQATKPWAAMNRTRPQPASVEIKSVFDLFHFCARPVSDADIHFVFMVIQFGSGIRRSVNLDARGHIALGEQRSFNGLDSAPYFAFGRSADGGSLHQVFRKFDAVALEVGFGREFGKRAKI